ncbi:MAG TPA: hypothetical protein VEZ70_04585 [Allosphingosinicella sp.]|nr:hypothetical protein [Allosphingosinicella sp.]
MRLTNITRRFGAFDFALAGFAGAAFAFAAFAMPDWRLTQIVLATSLPSVLPSAEPPLGFTARTGFALLIGFLAFAGSFALLRLAGRAPVRPRASSDADAPPAPIRLRRADAHPDAPPRRPLIARDLGEPEDPPAQELLLTPEPEEAEALVQPDHAPEPIPHFLVPEADDAESAQFGSAEPADDTILVWPGADSKLDLGADPEPVQDAEPQPAPASADEPVPETETAPAAAEQEPEQKELAPAPVPQSPPEAPLEAEFEPEPAPVRAPRAAVLPAADDAADEEEASLGGLMKRLEFGLARRERSAPLDPAAVAPPADAAVGHRLRTAINDLNKLAARG